SPQGTATTFHPSCFAAACMAGVRMVHVDREHCSQSIVFPFGIGLVIGSDVGMCVGRCSSACTSFCAAGMAVPLVAAPLADAPPTTTPADSPATVTAAANEALTLRIADLGRIVWFPTVDPGNSAPPCSCLPICALTRRS